MSLASPERAARMRHLSLLPTGLALLIAFVLLMLHQYVVGRAALIDELKTEAAIIGANSSAALVFNDAQAGGEILGAVRLTPRVVGGALYRADGALLVRVPEEDASLLPALPSAADAPGARIGGLRGELREAVMLDGVRVGTLLLRVEMTSLYWRLIEYALGVLAIAAIALALAYRLTAPLRRRVIKAEAQLVQLAHYDQVTGLPNRRLFEQELKKAAGRIHHDPRGAALFFVDIDDFKKVNDAFGHETGDRALTLIGERIRDVVRAGDAVARLEGDEFAVILYEIGHPDHAAKVAREMVAAMSEPLLAEASSLHVGLSVGIAMLPVDGDDPAILLQRAGMAMRVAKMQGKGGFQFFSEDIDARVRRDLQLEAGLRQALQGDATGLWVAYQPQYCARTRKCLGVEALLRWTRADGGGISPGEFIPIAEKSGLITGLGDWVLNRVCQDLAAWRAQGIEIPKVAINVSPRQLLRGAGVVDNFCRTLRAHGETVARIEIELTENALMEDRGAAVLDAFRAAGFELAIDDFGTGYSSLGYLKRFQVSTLKIDQRFVRLLPDNAEDAAIVTAVIQMARALNVRVVAEGVESEAQAAFLVACGCDILQGYLLGRPLPPDELARALSSGR